MAEDNPKGRLQEYLKLVYPDPSDPEDEKAMRRVSMNRSLAERFFRQGVGNQQKGVAGTLWAAYNGIAEMVDHQRSYQTAAGRLDSIWFGTGHTTKARAFRVAQEKAKVWLN